MVKCADCGFIALRHYETRELREAEGDYRQTGVIPSNINQPKYLYEDRPLCLQRVVIFDADQCETSAGRAALLQEERGECAGFTNWRQGFTPQEHREKLDQQQVIEREDRRDTDQREWQKAMTETSWKRDDVRHTREMWIIGGVVTLIVVLSTIAGAMIEAGWIARPW